MTSQCHGTQNGVTMSIQTITHLTDKHSYYKKHFQKLHIHTVNNAKCLFFMDIYNCVMDRQWYADKFSLRTYQHITCGCNYVYNNKTHTSLFKNRLASVAELNQQFSDE